MIEMIPGVTTKAGWAVDEPLVFELSTDCTSGPAVTAAGVPVSMDDTAIPQSLLRSAPAQVPHVPEPVLARHFGRLARRNHNLHEGMYPLGSCTMKYNPVVDEQLAWLDGFANLHPYQDEADTQGALQLMWELDRLLASITGMARMSLQPAAGAHGEWTGLRMIQAYHASRGDTARTRVLIPDSAHGTNPASAAACGLDVVTVKSNHDGTVDVADFSQHLDDTVAAVMLTNPNTLGVFEKDIVEIARLAHEAGALVYYDGANLNALVGVARPGDMGFDVVHLNLHTTF
jgi:glycine dehydrogenase subunit 2